jgi:hypothetical protein
MAPDDSHGTQSGGTRTEPMLTLELVIFRSQPLSGQIGPAGTPDGSAFHGWIDLMSAIHTLCAGDS